LRKPGRAEKVVPYWRARIDISSNQAGGNTAAPSAVVGERPDATENGRRAAAPSANEIVIQRGANGGAGDGDQSSGPFSTTSALAWNAIR
jgi:hypothetical protein